VGLHPFSSNLWPDKWDLREEYGGPNFGEKEFQLFQLLYYRYFALTNGSFLLIQTEAYHYTLVFLKSIHVVVG